MLFDSFDFAVFLPLVFIGYWFITNRSLKLQNLFILAASYIFYGWWDFRFLGLIAISTLVDYFVGIAIHSSSTESKRKILLWISIAANLGLLVFFKYSNFFLSSFITAFSFFGQPINWSGINIVLPVGISFYTFQTMSYTIDIYRKKLTPTTDLISFAAFVGFFPQLVAGPIERATNLLPQFSRPRVFKSEQATDGLRQILWGLFKKMVIADNCALYVGEVFGNYQEQSGSTLLMGACIFFVQVYCDFSGYSDIAIGTGRLFGFSLMRNFAFPFFTTSISKFWQSWHISLTTWCRDYIYIPLGGNRKGKVRQFFNTLITFSVMGLWHGAKWTFVVWGVLNALYFIPSLARNSTQNRPNDQTRQAIPSLKEVPKMLVVFLAVGISLVFFRANDMSQALQYFKGMISLSFFTAPAIPSAEISILIVLFILVEWMQRERIHAFQFDPSRHPVLLRWVAYLATAFLINWYGFIPKEFIYFQF